MRKRILGVVVVGGLIGGMMAVAAPADAADVSLMSCDNVVNRAKILAPATARNVAEGVPAKSGIGFQTKDLQVAGIGPPEGVVADADPKATIKYEVDDWITPRAGYTADWFDSDTCSGLLTVSDQTAAADGGIPDFSAAPWGPLYSSAAPEAPLGEAVKLAGKLTGRADCDPALPGDDTSWTLHGKLTAQWGQGAALANSVHLDAAGKKVASQIYLRVNPDNSLNVDLTMDTVGDTPDRVHLKGIVIKGVGNGSDFNMTGAYRPPFAILALAAEACSFNFDLTGDTVVGEKFSGLNNIVIDTDLDTFSDGTADPGTGLYNGSMEFSIPDGT